jgi:hypothetical protein
MDDKLKEIFSKKLEDHVSTIKPDMWSAVQGKLAAAGGLPLGAGAVKAGMGIWKSILLVGGISSVAIISSVVVFNNINQKEVQISEKVSTKSVQKSDPKRNVVIASKLPVNSVNEVKFQKKEFAYWGETMCTYPVDPISYSNENNNAIVESKEVQISENLLIEQIPTSVEDPNTEVTKMESPVEISNDQESKVTLFPNVFTPNGDGSNDNYDVLVVNVENVEMTILDSRNDVVFRSSETLSWDGITISGDKAKLGMYACIITGKDSKGKLFKSIQLFELK